MGHPNYVTFRFDGPDEEGTQRVTFIVAGTHRGGYAEGAFTWTGGLGVREGRELWAWASSRLFDSLAHGIQMSLLDLVDEESSVLE